MTKLDQLKSTYELWDQSSLEYGWSSRWGGTYNQWRKTIFPRVSRYLPTNSILEIGCGRGMLSQHLIHYTKSLTLVDFIDTRPQHILPTSAFESKVFFHHNDGITLNEIEDKSIDLAFSFFSLIDADEFTIHSYITELDRVLKTDGVAFLHHSNALFSPEQLEQNNSLHQIHSVRANDVSAQVVKNITNAFDLEPRIQECVAWAPGFPPTDCFTTLVRSSNIEVNNIGQYNNPYFEDEIRYGISDLVAIYGRPVGR